MTNMALMQAANAPACGKVKAAFREDSRRRGGDGTRENYCCSDLQAPKAELSSSPFQQRNHRDSAATLERIVFSHGFHGLAVVLTYCMRVVAQTLEKEQRIMIDARSTNVHAAAGLSPETLRARARCRRETAARLWDERLERLLLEEAEELESRAVALDLQAAIKVEAAKPASKIVQPDLAALREEALFG